MIAMTARKSAITGVALVALLGVAGRARAQDAQTKYPSMAPLEQYLIDDRDAEIALARSAAPASISGDAEVMVLTRHGYETAVKGKNGFVCLVIRSWDNGIESSEFWNPKLRAPHCFNAAAARFYLPRLFKKTGWVLAGRSKEEFFDALKAAVASNELRPPEPGTLVYMMSKQGYLSDRGGHWHPHVMFYFPSSADPATWGANGTNSAETRFAGSPVLAASQTAEDLLIYLIPVRMWSDGTPDLPPAGH